jgi:putative peptidoglycan lipid II flippase
MSVGTALSRLTGFGRVAVIAWAIGGVESKLPDTYQLANTFPSVFYHLILGQILVTALVPVFVEYVTERSDSEARSLSSTMLATTFLIATVASGIAILAAPWIIKIYSFRLEGPDRIAQEQVGAFWLRLLLPQMIFYTTGIVISGLLNAHRRFAAPMFAPIANNVVVALSFVIFRITHSADIPTLQTIDTSDKLLLGLGTTMGVVVQTVLLFPAVRRLPGRWFSLSGVSFSHPALRRVGNLGRYALGYVAMNQVALWAIKAMANGVKGGVTAYDTSFVLYSLPYGIFAVSVFTALVPALSEHHVKGDLPSFRADFMEGVRMTLFVVLPATAGFVALGQPIVRLLFERGVFGSASTELFAQTFVLMVLGLPAYAMFQQIVRAFYSMQDARTPFRINTVGVVLNIAAALVLFGPLAVPGLGLAHALTYLCIAITGWAMLHRRIGSLEPGLLAWFVRLTVASAATGGAAWFVARAVGASLDTSRLGGQLAQVFSAVTAGAVIFVVAGMIFRFDEPRRLWRMLRRASAP